MHLQDQGQWAISCHGFKQNSVLKSISLTQWTIEFFKIIVCKEFLYKERHQVNIKHSCAENLSFTFKKSLSGELYLSKYKYRKENTYTVMLESYCCV